MFNAGALREAVVALMDGVEIAAEGAMSRVMRQAEADARSTAHWRDANTYTVKYPSGEWTWTVTGLARASIHGYVVPNKRLKHFPDFWTTSYWNGNPRLHPHTFDDSITSSVPEVAGKISGVLTMNIAYAPHLQEYESREFGWPVTIETLDMNWAPVYAPMAGGEMQRRLVAFAAQYT